ncbi:hypothetical protein KM043_018016 [Ampulex compressa]|nr:hypothetical protein KM043_018016 [Ampulex compressa]
MTGGVCGRAAWWCLDAGGGGDGGWLAVPWQRELISQEPTPMETQASEEPHPSCTLPCSPLAPPSLPPLTSVPAHPAVGFIASYSGPGSTQLQRNRAILGDKVTS